MNYKIIKNQFKFLRNLVTQNQISKISQSTFVNKINMNKNFSLHFYNKDLQMIDDRLMLSYLHDQIKSLSMLVNSLLPF